MTSQWRHRNKTHNWYSELNSLQNVYFGFFIFGKLIEWRCFATYLWNDPRTTSYAAFCVCSLTFAFDLLTLKCSWVSLAERSLTSDRPLCILRFLSCKVKSRRLARRHISYIFENGALLGIVLDKWQYVYCVFSPPSVRIVWPSVVQLRWSCVFFLVQLILLLSLLHLSEWYPVCRRLPSPKFKRKHGLQHVQFISLVLCVRAVPCKN